MDDLISRQAVLDTISELNAVSFYEAQEDSKECYCEIRQAIKDLSPVKPQERTGHWKVVSDGYGDNAYICECSECKDTVWVYKDADRKWNYCPNCGARMVEPQERSE